MRLGARLTCIAACFAVFIGFLAGGIPTADDATAIQPSPSAQIVSTNDRLHRGGPTDYTAPDRAAPDSTVSRSDAYNAVDRWSHGSSPRPNDVKTTVAYDYDGDPRLLRGDSIAQTSAEEASRQPSLLPLAGVAAKGVTSGWRSGRELSLGKNLRVSLGNKGAFKKDGSPHVSARLPHYHRGRYDSDGNTLPGHSSSKRHRPWDNKSTDESFWDRF